MRKTARSGKGLSWPDAVPKQKSTGHPAEALKQLDRQQLDLLSRIDGTLSVAELERMMGTEFQEVSDSLRLFLRLGLIVLGRPDSSSGS